MNINSENSLKISYGGGHIMKIRRRVQTTTQTPLLTPPHHQPHNLHKIFEASLGGFDNSRERDRNKAFNSGEYFNRLRRLLNNSHWNSDDVASLYSPPLTKDYSSLFNVNSKEPVMKVPKIEVPVNNKYMPASTIWLLVTSTLFCIFCILKILAYAQRTKSEDRSIRRQMTEERSSSNISPANPQEHNNDNGSFSLLVNSEYSSQSDSYSDLPPTYFECAASNDKVVNKSFDVNSEEPPPPYSTCLETLKNTNEVPKIHKRQSEEQTKSSTDTGVHLSNVADTDRSSVVQNSSDAVTLSRVDETTIDTYNGNGGHRSE